MTDAAHENSLRLAELVDDLRRLVERILDHRERQGAPLPFGRAETDLQSDLHLHILDYVSFLEAQDNIEYDRDRDVLLAADAVDDVVEATEPWIDEVRFEFSKEIVDSPLDNSDAEDDDLEMIDEALDGDDEFGFDEVFQGGGEESLEMDESSIEMEVSRESSDVDVDPLDGQDRVDQIAPDSDPAARNSSEPPDETGTGDGGRLAADFSSDVDSTDDPDRLATVSSSDFESDGARSSRRSRRRHDESGNEPPSDEPSTSTDSKSMNDENRRRRGSSRRRSSSSDRERYERIEEIGSGGVGTVFKGRHVALDREVAIKEISNVFDVFADLKREDIVERFTDITQTQAAISHPAVLQIYDLETQTQYPFVVSEYAPRGSLRRLIETDEDRSLTIALKYFIQILHGLNAAHRADIVHGSLKPENVVLDASGNAKLSDFGLTTLVDLSGASNQVYVGVGTVSYMAPEQFEDPNAATVETDIYSLGIMFYEMLTGKVPGRRSPMPSSFYPEIPRKLDDIFDRMSTDEPEDRYQSIEAILTDFYGEDEIINLLDRQSGVVYLRDPIEYGDEPLVGEDGELRSEPVGPAAEPPVDEVADGGASEFATADGETDGEREQASAGEADGGETEVDVQDGDEADDGNEDEKVDLEEFEDELPDDVDPEDIDPEEADDEVLEKLDEYSEMFDDEEDEE